MGNTTSKKAGVSALKTPEKSTATASVGHSPSSPSSPSDNKEIDGHEVKQPAVPPTPAIPQTPLTETIVNHLNRITADDANQQQKIKTPSYLLRKKILYDLGYTYSLKENDPRSPSQCIPRTPLALDNNNSTAEPVTENDASSFQYNSTLEDSCRDFNTKLDEITMDETEMAKHDMLPNESDTTKSDENGEESLDSLCEQKTPDAESQNTPDFVAHTNVCGQNKTTEDNKNSNKMMPKTHEDDIDSNKSITSTPVTADSHRTGRIPLSVINRRVGMSTEKTPLQSKNTSATIATDAQRSNLSFGKHDENRGSARKSKIPVFKK